MLVSSLMALGDLTKQLVLDALRPADLPSISETLRTAGTAAPAQGENVCATVLAQVQAMQKALKEDQELVVLCASGAETIRVLEFFAPSAQVIVLTGIDAGKNITRVISHIESINLVCKVMKAALPGKPVRINFISPKLKPD